jgi:hypothetical protein
MADLQSQPGKTTTLAEPLQADFPPGSLDVERPEGPPHSKDAVKEIRRQENLREDCGG